MTAPGTPLPWRKGTDAGTIVSDSPGSHPLEPDTRRFYGGELVAESISYAADLEFILRAANAHDALMRACRVALLELQRNEDAPGSGTETMATATVRAALKLAGVEP